MNVERIDKSVSTNPVSVALRGYVRRVMLRLPMPVGAALWFAFFIGAGILIVFLLPAPRDLDAECRKQCKPRFSRVVPDKSYPMSAKGTYRQVCECY